MLAELFIDTLISIRWTAGTQYILYPVFAVALPLIFIAVYFAKAKEWQNDSIRIQGPRGHFYWGNTFDIGGKDVDLFARLISWSREYGDIYKLYSKPGGYFIYTSNPDHIRHVLQKNASNYTKSDVLGKMMNFASSSIFFATGKDHHIQKKHIRPAFTMHAVKVFMDIFHGKAQEFVKVILGNTPDNTGIIQTQLLEKLRKLCLDIIGECAIGHSFNSLIGSENEEVGAFLSLASHDFNLTRLALQDVLPFTKYIWLGEHRKITKAQILIKDLLKKAIEKRREELEDDDEVFEKGDLLDVLLKLYDNDISTPSEEDLCSQLYTFIFAGFEPISLTIFWTLFLLGKNTDIQSQVRDEIRQYLDQNGKLSLDACSQLHHLGSCVKEAQRLYPSAILIRRKAVKNDKLGNYEVPAGTDVAIGVCSVHRDPKYWSEPSEFCPDRFRLADDKDVSMWYKFLPYGRGPRMCLATWYAELHIKVVLAQIINQFHITLPSDQPTEPPCVVKVTLKPKTSPIFCLKKLL